MSKKNFKIGACTFYMKERASSGPTKDTKPGQRGKAIPLFYQAMGRCRRQPQYIKGLMEQPAGTGKMLFSNPQS